MAKGFGFTSYIVDNDKIFERAIKQAKKKIGNLKPALEEIGLEFLKSRRAIFTLKSPGQYPDLSTKPFTAFWPNILGIGARYEGGYKQYKQINFGLTYPILKVTGDLERSITSRGASGNRFKVDNESVTIGTKVPYAKYHQSDKPRKKIPLRKFLFIGPEAPKFAKGPLAGFPEAALLSLETFVLRTMGATIEEATGTAPVIEVTPDGRTKITAKDIK